MFKFQVNDESSPLTHVVMGLGAGYHRDPSRVEVVNTTQDRTAQSAGHPKEADVVREFGNFKTALEQAGVTVYVPDLAPDSVQDQTCPRDIGFVIGETFVVAGMRYASRVEEIRGLDRLLEEFEGPKVEVPENVALEGGDVIVDAGRIYVGCGQRSDAEGMTFLADTFGADWEVIPVPTKAISEGEEVLHLDCAFNPLGLGHALIYPDGLADIPQSIQDIYDWIEVTREEAAALAANVLSVAPDRLIARDHPSCRRVNEELRRAGYQLDEVEFDSVPSTGGSFRCATLPLRRSAR